MRYNISPAERAGFEEAWKVASNNYQQGKTPLPKIPGLSAEERSEEHEARRSEKHKVYGKMRHRSKPKPF